MCCVLYCCVLGMDGNGNSFFNPDMHPHTHTHTHVNLVVFICSYGEMWHWEMMKLQLSCHQTVFPWRLYQMAWHPWGFPICLFRSHKYCLPQVRVNKAILNLLSARGKTSGRLVLHRHVGLIDPVCSEPSLPLSDWWVCVTKVLFFCCCLKLKNIRKNSKSNIVDCGICVVPPKALWFGLDLNQQEAARWYLL